MKDITALINSYRECSRNLWNVYFSRMEFTWDLHDDYESIRRLLFESLVVNQLDSCEECSEGDRMRPPVLMVVPDATSVPILINRPSDDGAGYWDQEMEMSVDVDEVQLAYVDLFDYSQYPVKDFRFYRCKILRFAAHAKYEGREALLEVSHTKVFHDE
jgi:hypothetical protein